MTIEELIEFSKNFEITEENKAKIIESLKNLMKNFVVNKQRCALHQN